MKYKVTHNTAYGYQEMVSVCHNEAYLTPRPRFGQVCEYHRLLVTPPPATTGRRQDYFGNPLSYFSFNEGFDKLHVKAVSRVEVSLPAPAVSDDSQPWEQVVAEVRNDRGAVALNAYQFAFESPLVPTTAELAEYGRSAFTSKKPIVAALAELTSRIHEDFEFDATATSVSTPVLQVLEARRGVCQDFAHLQVAVLRSLGLPARYVSGYVRTYPPPGKERMVGADASHAWVSVYCGSAGWVDVDPTNNLFPSEDHITLAWGRDYSDVCPIKGVFVGGGATTLKVSVDVLPLAD